MRYRVRKVGTSYRAEYRTGIPFIWFSCFGCITPAGGMHKTYSTSRAAYLDLREYVKNTTEKKFETQYYTKEELS